MTSTPPPPDTKAGQTPSATELRAREMMIKIMAALDGLLTYDRVERPAFRSKPLGAPNSTVRIQQEKLIALEDAALAALSLVRGEGK